MTAMELVASNKCFTRGKSITDCLNRVLTFPIEAFCGKIFSIVSYLALHVSQDLHTT